MVGVGSTVLHCVLYLLSWVVGQRAVFGTVRVGFPCALRGGGVVRRGASFNCREHAL